MYYLDHVVVSRCCCHVETRSARVVGDLEELGGPGEEEAHHAHVSRDAGQVQGDVAAGLAGSVNLPS